MKNFFRIFCLSAIILGLSFQTTFAKQEIIEATGRYVMDLKVDETFAMGTSRAREEAKRVATEKAGVYIQSYSKTVNLVLEYDEIQTVAAKLLKIQDEKVASRSLEDGLLEVIVTIKALVDDNNNEMLKTMMTDKQNLANATERYKNLQQEYDALKKQMEELKQNYYSASPSQQIELKKSIAQNNKYFEAFLALEEGNNFYFDYNFQAAISSYTKAININQNFAEAYNNRGNAYVMTKNYQQAAQDYQSAIRCNKVDSRIYNNLGGIYFMLKNYNESINAYTQAIKLNPNLFDAYYNRAMAYYRVNQFQNALADAQQAINLKPSDTDARNLYTQIARNLQ